MTELATPIYFFVSPHLDDAVFSCGGLAYRLAQSGEKVIIVTMATSDEPEDRLPSWLANRYVQGWNLGLNPFVVRRQEDEAAARTLGAEIKHLGFLDAIYRTDSRGQPLYNRAIAPSPVHEHDWKAFMPPVRETLRFLRKQYGNQRVIMFCTLGIGGHPDHQIIRRAVESITEPRDRVYYEDFPYCIQPKPFTRASVVNANLTRDLCSVTVQLSPTEIDARQRAMACYPSQVPGCFPSYADILTEILRARLPAIGRRIKYTPDLTASLERMNSQAQAYITRVGGERYWLQTDEKVPGLD